jgi:hypothetical protein
MAPPLSAALPPLMIRYSNRGPKTPGAIEKTRLPGAVCRIVVGLTVPEPEMVSVFEMESSSERSIVIPADSNVMKSLFHALFTACRSDPSAGFDGLSSALVTFHIVASARGANPARQSAIAAVIVRQYKFIFFIRRDLLVSFLHHHPYIRERLLLSPRESHKRVKTDRVKRTR